MSKNRLRLTAYWATVLLLLAGLLSCKAPKDASYFQTIKGDTTLQNTVSKNFDLKIRPDDLLSIGITSASPELSTLYNSAQAIGTAAGGNAAGYLVDKAGNIQLYKLGNVKVAGLTRDEVKARLETDLAPYLKEPVVTVRLANNRITVLGAVGSPGTIDMPTDQISVLEAIGQRGDLAKNAKLDKILVIRQTEGGKEFRHLNLADHSVFSSPYFYLQNGDVVYVAPDEKKGEQPKVQQVIAYAVSGISIISLILSRIR